MEQLERTVAVVEEREDSDATNPPGLMLHGIVSVRGHERALARLAAADSDKLIEHHGLAALVQVVPYRVPDWEQDQIRRHSRRIERAMRRSTIVPAPYGIVFRDEQQVKEFLDYQHIALDEALSFLDGAWEVRLHLERSDRQPNLSENERSDRAAEIYTALRRRSRATLPLALSGDRILSAAFLVDRSQWVHFEEYADHLEADHPEFTFDRTGPWPAYDFVRMAFVPQEKPSV